MPVTTRSKRPAMTVEMATALIQDLRINEVVSFDTDASDVFVQVVRKEDDTWLLDMPTIGYDQWDAVSAADKARFRAEDRRLSDVSVHDARDAAKRALKLLRILHPRHDIHEEDRWFTT